MLKGKRVHREMQARHLIHWTRPSVWKTDANHVPIPAFRNKSRILEFYHITVWNIHT